MAHVVVTRPVGRERPLVARLRALGHEVTHVPLVEIELLGDGPVDVTGYDWVVVTSVTGARELRRRMRGSPGRVAAIGQATADAFGGADLIASSSTQEGLLAAMPPRPGRVLFAGAEGARRLLPESLSADVVTLYRTRELVVPGPLTGDLVVLASASAARALAASGSRLPAVSIGPETSSAARALGIEIVVEASGPDMETLAAATDRAATMLAARRHTP